MTSSALQAGDPNALGDAASVLPPQEPTTHEAPPAVPYPDVVRHLAAVRGLLGLILLVLMTIGLYFAKAVVLPILMGGILALTLGPLARSLQRIGLATQIAALILILSVSATIGGGAFFVSGPVAGWIEYAPELASKLKLKLAALTDSVEAVKAVSDQVGEMTTESSDPAVQRVSVQSPGLLTSAVSNLSSVVMTILVALVLAFFLLSSGNMFYIKMLEAFPKFGDKRRALRIIYGIERSVSHYLLTVTLINAGFGVVIGAAMWLIGMPQPMVWAAAAFLLNFVPYFGTVVGVGLSAAVAIVSFDSLVYALLAPAAFLAANALEGQFLTPILLGRRLELNTVSVFITLVFWGWLWGIAGALMAVPFLVCLKVICDNVAALQTLGNFLSAARPAAVRNGQEEP